MYYNKDTEDIFKELVSGKSGLDEKKVNESRIKYGENVFEEKEKKTIFQVFGEQFKDLLVIILIMAALISIATGNLESTAVIIAVLILNAVLGTVQYVKAEKSLQSLKNLSSPNAKVIRNGKKIEIAASELVVGDIFTLEAGDVIPGDGRIIDNFSLKVNESALTGESESVEKQAATLPHKSIEDKVALGDQKNMVFSGSLVTYGRATVIVTSVGSKTQLGQIATLMNKVKKKKTPLQITMDSFSKKLSIGIIILCALVFALNIYRHMAILDSLLFAVALAVAAIPEALTSIITISLAIGTKRMAEEHAIIKELSAVEGLGCVSIICSDKTGTLTQNKMTVEDKYVLPGQNADMLTLASVLCNDTTISEGAYLGDPTETALVEYFVNNGGKYEEMQKKYPRYAEIPFDSDRKLMTTYHVIDGEGVLFTKGAIDVMLNRVSGLSQDEVKQIEALNSQWSQDGLRVLAFAMKIVNNLAADEIATIDLSCEHDLTFIGLMAEMDPPREESAIAVADCKKAGIKAIMITGDHKITASAIARRIGIMEDGDIAITGPELDAMSDKELMDKLERISLYARVSPSNKIRIVKAWQSLGHIVAMTGDGVNDAPALKNADVGVAMGITGTDVSKDAASMILTDDNFATIVKSVLNGRNIYANIKNSILFLLSGNMAGIFVVLAAALLGLPSPFTAVHLLFINLLTDSMPALAINMESLNHDLINQEPRPRDESVITKENIVQIILQGALIGAATLVAFYIGIQNEGNYGAMTMAFATLCLARLWHGFNSRGTASIFKLGIFSNIAVVGAFIGGLALLAAVMFIPVLQKLFTIDSMMGINILYIIALSIAPTIIIQAFKVFYVDNKLHN
ncbi:cation-translocating P-type ATPase [Eubacteriales bacterium KG127]